MPEGFVEVDELASRIRRSIGLCMRRLTQLFDQDELRMPEVSALAKLDRNGAMSVSDLARAEQITPQAMAATVAGLEERNLVTRRRDPSDARRVLMSLTESGRDALGSKRSAQTRQLSKVLTDDFTTDERKLLEAAVALIDRLGESL